VLLRFIIGKTVSSHLSDCPLCTRGELRIPSPTNSRGMLCTGYKCLSLSRCLHTTMGLIFRFLLLSFLAPPPLERSRSIWCKAGCFLYNETGHDLIAADKLGLHTLPLCTVSGKCRHPHVAFCRFRHRRTGPDQNDSWSVSTMQTGSKTGPVESGGWEADRSFNFPYQARKRSKRPTA